MNEQIIFPKIKSTGKVKTMSVKTKYIKQCRFVKLAVTYDPKIAKPKKVTLQKGIEGSVAFGNQIEGLLIISWFTYPGVDLPHNAVFLKIQWGKVGGGISWIGVMEGAGSFGCRMMCNNVEVGDSPTDKYYKAGAITFS